MSREAFFKRNRNITNRVIRGRLAKTGRIVHGTRAQNAQLPRFLTKKTTDWDIFAKMPKKAALAMEKALDKKFGGDFFDTKEGTTRRLKVHKVFSNVTGKTVADFSLPDRMVPTVAKRGVRFATLKDQVTRAEKVIRDPTTKFRREKDLDFLRRIKEFQKLRGRKL